jgi:hypothetical protein
LAKNEVRIKINAKDKASGALKGVKNALIGLGVAWLSMRGIRAVIDSIGEVTMLAMKQENAVVKLNQQLKNHNELTVANTKALLDQASALQQQTTFSDDAIISAQAMLASFNLSTEQMIRMTPRLLDVAIMTQNTTGAMQDLATTAKMVGVALGGQAGRLTQMGIKLSDQQKALFGAASEQEKFNMLIQIFDDNAKGLATSLGTTLQGRMTQMRNNIGDLKEVIGNTIVKSEAWSAMLTFISQEINKLTKWLSENQEEVKEWGNNFAFTVVNTTRTVIDTLADLATAYSAVMIPILEFFKITAYLSGSAWLDIRNSLDATIDSLDKFGVGAQATKLKLDALAELLERKMLQAVYATKKGVDDLFKPKPPDPNDPINKIEDMTEAMIKFNEEVGGATALERLENFKMTAKEAFDIMIERAQTLLRITYGLPIHMETFTKKVEKQKDVWADLGSQVVAYGHSFLDNVVDAFVEGKLVWTEFAQQFMRDITKMIIKTLMLKAIQSAFGGGSLPIPGMQTGGAVESDMVARLHKDEFVMSSPAVARIGMDRLNAMNQGDTFNSALNLNVTVNGNDGSKVAYEIIDIVEREFPTMYHNAIRRRQI